MRHTITDGSEAEAGGGGVTRRPPFSVPVRTTAGVREVSVSPGRAVQTMHAPGWLLDAGGTVLAGALGILTDSALGTAVMSTVATGVSMVTSHLHLELLAPIPDGTTELLVEGRRRSLSDRFGLGEGEVHTAAGVEIARATIGSMLITGRPSFARPSAAPTDHLGTSARRDAPRAPARATGRGGRLIAGQPVHEHMRTEVVSAGRRGVTLRIPAAPGLANSSGGLHGGIGVLFGERGLDLALQVAIAAAATEGEGSPVMRLVELRAAFVRGIPADGASIDCQAAVVHLGRRLAAARGEVRTQEGRIAVLVDATYVAVGTAPAAEP